jgi:F-type H+-transporting ATPase subunit b
VSPALTTFLFEVANFLILAGVLSWLLFRPVRAAIEKRRTQIAQQKEQAADKLADAERSRKEIEQRKAELEEELRQKRKQAEQQASQKADSIIAQAREDAQQERDALKRQLATLEDARIERISRIVAAVAGQAVAQLLQEIAGADLDKALLHEACQRLQSFDGNSISPVVVESARELSEEERESIQSAVKGEGDEIEFRVSDDLKVGLRISTNHGLIDVSDSGLAEFAERELESRLKSLSPSNNHQAKHAESR